MKKKIANPVINVNDDNNDFVTDSHNKIATLKFSRKNSEGKLKWSFFCYSVKKRIKKKEKEEEKKLQARRRREKSFSLGEAILWKIHSHFPPLHSWGWREAESACLLSDTQKISAEKKGEEGNSLTAASTDSWLFCGLRKHKKTSHHHHFGYIISNFFLWRIWREHRTHNRRICSKPTSSSSGIGTSPYCSSSLRSRIMVSSFFLISHGINHAQKCAAMLLLPLLGMHINCKSSRPVFCIHYSLSGSMMWFLLIKCSEEAASKKKMREKQKKWKWIKWAIKIAADSKTGF